MFLIKILIISLIFLILYIILKKTRLLIDDTGSSSHKKFVNSNSKPILLGGIFFLIVTVLLLPNINLIFKILVFFIFFLGILSDINFLNDPLKRILTQILLVSLFVIGEEIFIRSLSLDFFDKLMQVNTINILFTIFCFLILINGTNFIDGLNILASGYFLMITLSLIFLNQNILINILHLDAITLVCISLIIFMVFNFFNLVYLGDSGSYLISLLIGYFVVLNFNNNFSISPYYVCLLFWYPAYENLFSLLRRSTKKKIVSNPDNQHLHQLIFIKIKNFTNKSHIVSNLISSSLILFYNLIIFILAFKFYSSTNILVLIISTNIVIYTTLYYFLSKDLMNNK